MLWSLCLLSAFAVILGSQVRQKAVLIKRLDERSRLRFIAEAGSKKAAAELKKWQLKGLAYATLNDDWSNNPAAFKDIAIGGGKFNIYYNYIGECLGGQEVRYGLVDEESKINVNKFNNIEVLTQLFTAVLGYDPIKARELAVDIIDWRDADSSGGDTESGYYDPYKIKNAEFKIPEELLLVRGVDEGVLSKIRNYITVFGGNRVNINTAPAVVLQALGLSSETISSISVFRAGEDGIIGTGDENPFVSFADISSKLEIGNLPESERKAISDYLGVTSHNFLARCSVQLNNSKNASDAYCILNVSTDAKKVKILYWREP